MGAHVKNMPERSVAKAAGTCAFHDVYRAIMSECVLIVSALRIMWGTVCPHVGRQCAIDKATSSDDSKNHRRWCCDLC